MSVKTTNKQIIKEVPWGMLVWECEGGLYAADDDGNLMHVYTTEHNVASEKALEDAAKFYGFPPGKPVFLSGRRPITDEELESQLSRAAAGLVPDPLDIAAINDDMRALRAQNRG